MADVHTGTAKGAKYVWWGRVDSSGNLVGSDGSAPAAGNQDGVSMARLRGVKNASVQPEDAARAEATGDDGVLAIFIDEPTSLPSSEWNFGAFDLDFEATVQGTKVHNIGNFNFGSKQPSGQAFPDIAFIVQGQGKSLDAATSGASLVYGEAIHKANVTARGRDAFAENEVGQFTYSMVANRSTENVLNGMAFTDELNGTTEMVTTPFTSAGPVHRKRFTGDGTQVTFNLDYTPLTDDGSDMVVVVGGTAQTITTAYTINKTNKTITFEAGAVPAENAVIDVLYAFEA